VPDRVTQTQTIESLRSLLDRLGSAELTLTEAKALRAELQRVVASSESSGRGDLPGPHSLVGS
jgi:hypothetical protein